MGIEFILLSRSSTGLVSTREALLINDLSRPGTLASVVRGRVRKLNTAGLTRCRTRVG